MFSHSVSINSAVEDWLNVFSMLLLISIPFYVIFHKLWKLIFSALLGFGFINYLLNDITPLDDNGISLSFLAVILGAILGLVQCVAKIGQDIAIFNAKYFDGVFHCLPLISRIYTDSGVFNFD